MYRYRVAQFFDAFAASCKAILRALAEIGEKLMALYERGKRHAAGLAECRCEAQNETGEAIPAGSVVQMAWGPEGWKILRVLPGGEARPARLLPQSIRGSVVRSQGWIDGKPALLVEDHWTRERFGAIVPEGVEHPRHGSTVRIRKDVAWGRYRLDEVLSEPGPIEAPAEPSTFLGELDFDCPAREDDGSEGKAIVYVASLGQLVDARNGLGRELPEGTKVRVARDPNPPGWRIESVESYPGKAHPDLTPPVGYQTRVAKPPAPALPAPPDMLALPAPTPAPSWVADQLDRMIVLNPPEDMPALPSPSKGSVILGDIGGENMVPFVGPKAEH